VLRVVEGTDTTGGREAVLAASARTSFEPGTSEVGATVTVTWATERA
jgi:hypothetical protein